MRRPTRSRVNPMDLGDFLEDSEVQALVEEGRAYQRERKEAEETFRASFQQGLSAQALALIRPALSDQAVARKVYQRLNVELGRRLSKSERRPRIEARRALEELYGVNALRDFSKVRREQDVGDPPSRGDWPTGLPYFTTREYTIQSKPIYRGVQRKLKLVREYDGIAGQLEADRALARALLEKKYELDRKIDKARSAEKRTEFNDQLTRLKELARAFIDSRQEMWKSATNDFAPKMGREFVPSQAVPPKTQQARGTASPLDLTPGTTVTGTGGDYIGQVMEIIGVQGDNVEVKIAKARVTMPIRRFRRLTRKLD